MTDVIPYQPRDLEFERALLETTCPHQIDSEVLLQAMWARAADHSGQYVHDPLNVRLDVDWLPNAREELEDAPFYLVQDLRQHQDNLPRTELLLQALTLVARAHDLIRQAERL